MTTDSVKDYKVRVSYCDYQASDDEVYEALQRTTAPLTRTWDKLAEAKKIAIKFNQDWPHEHVIYHKGQRRQLVSDKVARATLRLLRERTSAELMAVDASYHIFYGHKKQTYESTDQVTTLMDVLREFDVRMVDGTRPPYKMVTVPGGGRMFEQYYMMQDAVDTDAMVSVAKLKNHAYMGVTGCLKNLFGLMPIDLPGRPRQYLHHLVRMPYMLTDIGRIFDPVLNIVDGLIGQASYEWCDQEDTGREVNALIAGDQVVATDAVMAHIMGHDPMADWLTAPFNRDRNALRVASDSGFGTANLDEIDWASEVEPQPEGTFYARVWDSQEVVVEWIRTMCEQGLYYRDHMQELIRQYPEEFILLQDGEVKWHSLDGHIRQSRRTLAGQHRNHAMFYKYVDPEEKEQEHFEVYEQGLALIKQLGV